MVLEMSNVVKVKMGARVNMGDYNWLDAEYEVTAEVLPGESTPDALQRVESLVDRTLTAKIREARRGSGQ